MPLAITMLPKNIDPASRNVGGAGGGCEISSHSDSGSSQLLHLYCSVPTVQIHGAPGSLGAVQVVVPKSFFFFASAVGENKRISASEINSEIVACFIKIDLWFKKLLDTVLILAENEIML